MELSELLTERQKLYNDQRMEIQAIKTEYRLKIQAIDSQIKTATKKGVGKRIRAAKRGKRFADF